MVLLIYEVRVMNKVKTKLNIYLELEKEVTDEELDELNLESKEIEVYVKKLIEDKIDDVSKIKVNSKVIVKGEQVMWIKESIVRGIEANKLIDGLGMKLTIYKRVILILKIMFK